MPDRSFIPNRLITGVLITPVAHPEQAHILCKSCFAREYEIDETSISTACQEPQPDLLVEKFTAFVASGQCPRCGRPLVP